MYPSVCVECIVVEAVMNASWFFPWMHLETTVRFPGRRWSFRVYISQYFRGMMLLFASLVSVLCNSANTSSFTTLNFVDNNDGGHIQVAILPWTLALTECVYPLTVNIFNLAPLMWTLPRAYDDAVNVCEDESISLYSLDKDYFTINQGKAE
ncbi:hypothetical protein HID58_023626, partial [Brassica napus]